MLRVPDGGEEISTICILAPRKISSIAMAEGTLSGVLGKTEVWALRKHYT
ncbi:mCG1039626 [Mus musculus]|nr:mCG1039626 [Mus musculus]